MPNTKIVTAIGNIDGSNTVFFAGEPYTSGFTRYILNGRIHATDSDDYAFVESNPDTGQITVINPPKIGDVVQLFIVDRRPTIIAAVQRLSGQIRKLPNHLVGVIHPPKVRRLYGVVKRGT